MRATLLLLLALAGCAGPPARPVVTEPAARPGGAPTVTVGGDVRGLYGAVR